MRNNKDQLLFSFQITHWANHSDALRTVREQVFIQEQQVPIELEWDDLDNSAIHILAESVVTENQMTVKKLAIGTARITLEKREHQATTAHIGRMAVLAAWRNQGVGSKILQIGIKECQRLNITKIILNAQVNAIPFYQKAGFKISSSEFLDANIPHKEMTLEL